MKSTKVRHLNPRDFELAASDIVRRDLRKISSTRRDRLFRSFFGCSSKVCALVWRLIDPYRSMIREYTTVSPKHYLWCLMFLKIYANENVHSSMAGVDPKTFRKWCWIFVKKIANLDVELVSLFVPFILYLFIICQSHRFY